MRSVPAKIGRQWDGTVEILSGLHEGDLVVVDPDKDMKDGRRVKVKE